MNFFFIHLVISRLDIKDALICYVKQIGGECIFAVQVKNLPCTPSMIGFEPMS